MAMAHGQFFHQEYHDALIEPGRLDSGSRSDDAQQTFELWKKCSSRRKCPNMPSIATLINDHQAA